MLELNLPWTKLLPLALLRMWTKPWKDIGLSPYEVAYMGRDSGLPTIETKDKVLRNYVLVLFSALSLLRKQGLPTQTPLLELTVHKFQPGVWVLIKTGMKKNLLQPGIVPTKSSWQLKQQFEQKKKSGHINQKHGKRLLEKTHCE